MKPQLWCWARARIAAGLGLSLLLAGWLSGCTKDGEKSVKEAADHAATLAAIVEKDVAEVERGLPEGAKRLSVLFAKGADPRQDLTAVKNALTRVRATVDDLSVAKTTFFVLLDDKGKAIRSDWKSDSMAQSDLFAYFPSLPAAKTSDYHATTGQFPGTADAHDMDWIAGSPVKREDGSVGGVFATGWPYRAYAKHLFEILKNRLVEKTKKEGTRIPIFYVALFDKNEVYTPQGTPQVIEKTMAVEDLVGKTAAGPRADVITIEGRVYGYGAVRIEKMAKDTGVLVLRSEL